MNDLHRIVCQMFDLQLWFLNEWFTYESLSNVWFTIDWFTVIGFLNEWFT